MGIRFVFYLLFITLILIACDHKLKHDSSHFVEQFQRIEDLGFSDYDSMVSMYYHLDVEKTNWNPNQLQFLKNLLQSQMYYRKGKHNDAIQKLDNALFSLSLIPNSDSLKAFLYNAKGVNYMCESKYDSAVANIQKSYTIYEKLNMPFNAQKTNVNLAQLYYDKGDYEKSHHFIDLILENPLSIKHEMKAKHLKANLFGSSGLIDSAIALDYEVLRNTEIQANDTFYLSMFFNNLALCYLNKNKIDSAIYFCHKSFEIDSALGNEMNMAANLGLIADIYSSQQSWENANFFYQKAIDIFTKNNNLDKKLSVFKQLKKLYLTRGDLKKAIQFQDSIQMFELQINGLALNQTIELLNIEYETTRKNQQIENQELKLRIQRILLWGILLIGLILVPLLVLYFKTKNRKTELKLIKQEQRLSWIADEAEQNERKRIAGDLHDSISQKLAVAKMRLSMYKDESKNEKTTIENLIDESIKEIRDISHNLAPKEIENGLLPSIISLVEQLNYVQKKSKIHFETTVKSNELKLQKNISLFIYRIIQEALHNALKHADAQLITVIFALNKSELILRIIDDGKGFDKERISQFSGLGLRNLLSRVEQMHGKVNLETSPEKGTQIEILINLNYE